MSMTYKLSEIMPPAFFELHRRIRAGEVTEALCEGGRGGAKSSFISEEIELQMMRHPDTHAVVLRRKENTLRRTVYNQYIWAAGALGVGSKWKATVSPMELTYLPTGQKIMFFGLDDPGNLKSIKLPFGYVAYVHFEELDQFRGPEEVRNVEQSLLRGGPIAITFKSFNPPASAANWANQYARESKPGQVKHHSTYLETPPEWLGPRFIADAEHLKALRPMAYRNEYLGEVTGGGANVFENIQLRAITDEELGRFDRIYRGIDWGYYRHHIGQVRGADQRGTLLRQAGKQALCLALQRGTGQENPHRRGKDLLLRKHLRRKRGEIRRMDTKGYCSRPVLRRQHQGATASIQHPLDWGAHLWRCGHHGRQAHLYPWIVCVGGITYGQPEHRREGGASVYRQRRESSH